MVRTKLQTSVLKLEENKLCVFKIFGWLPGNQLLFDIDLEGQSFRIFEPLLYVGFVIWKYIK